MIWEPSQLLYLFLLYLLLTVPFACGATCVGLALLAFPIGHNLHRALLVHIIWRGLALILMWRAHYKAAGLHESAAY